MATSNARIIRTVKTGPGKGTPVRSFANFLPGVTAEIIAAKTTQLRVLAEGSADLLVERLFAGNNSGLSVAQKPGRFSKGEGIGESKQPLKLQELSAPYAARKRSLGLDGRILLASGEYINAIEVIRTETKAGGIVWRVRLRPGRHSSGLTYRQLGLVHEFGSAKAKVPPRPHWRPVAAQVFRAFRRISGAPKADAIRRAIGRMK